jgi:hypothetical protein
MNLTLAPFLCALTIVSGYNQHNQSSGSFGDGHDVALYASSDMDASPGLTIDIANHKQNSAQNPQSAGADIALALIRQDVEPNRKASESNSATQKAESPRAQATILQDKPPASLMEGVLLDPETLDLGRVQIGTTATGQVTLVNMTDDAVLIERVSSSCGCTAVHVPEGPIQPWDAVDITIEFKVPSRPGKAGRKTLRFELRSKAQAFDPLSLPVTATGVEFVTLSPQRVEIPAGESPSSGDAKEPSKGAATTLGNKAIEIHLESRRIDETGEFKSIDPIPFRITQIAPVGILSPADSPQAATGPSASQSPGGESLSHTLILDPDRWRAAGSPRSIQLTLDHPHVPQLTLRVAEKRERISRPEIATRGRAGSYRRNDQSGRPRRGGSGWLRARSRKQPQIWPDVRILELGELSRQSPVEQRIVFTHPDDVRHLMQADPDSISIETENDRINVEILRFEVVDLNPTQVEEVTSPSAGETESQAQTEVGEGETGEAITENEDGDGGGDDSPDTKKPATRLDGSESVGPSPVKPGKNVVKTAIVHLRIAVPESACFGSLATSYTIKAGNAIGFGELRAEIVPPLSAPTSSPPTASNEPQRPDESPDSSTASGPQPDGGGSDGVGDAKGRGTRDEK